MTEHTATRENNMRRVSLWLLIGASSLMFPGCGRRVQSSPQTHNKLGPYRRQRQRRLSHLQ